MKKAKLNIKNILAYFQGNLRYRLFYSKFAFLIPRYIREQIQVRINSMDSECYEAGECKLCGCQTTALQMANKACDKPCYPKMLSKKEWSFLQKGSMLYDANIDKYWGLSDFFNIFVKARCVLENPPKPKCDLEKSKIELFKSCEADIKVLEPFTLEDLRNGKLIKEAIIPNNNCE